VLNSSQGLEAQEVNRFAPKARLVDQKEEYRKPPNPNQPVLGSFTTPVHDQLVNRLEVFHGSTNRGM
jgi:hypothetical protein